jgi:uncharacterized protein
MRSARPLLAALIASLALLALAGAAGGAAPNGPSPSLVISQVYGGGGNTGATRTHDYIEIFNRGTTTVSLTGKSLQYASATGTGNFGNGPVQLTELSGTVAPGQYFLVREAAGNTPPAGSPLPTPDLDDPTPINMAAGAGKVAIAEGTASLGCNTAATCAANGNDVRIIDLVGYGGANYFEGAAAAPTASNTNAVFRSGGGCQDTDNNGADFAAATPSPRTTSSPRNLCSADAAPFVAETTPPNGGTEVPTGSNVTVTFSEPVTAATGAFALTCSRTGSVALNVTPSGSATTYVLDPQVDLQRDETCTVTIEADAVTDVDEVDPPDNMAADYSFSFSTTGLALRIHDIQGARHISSFNGSFVSQVPGVVTATSSNGFWFQDPQPDMDVRSSEGIFVFTDQLPSVAVGQAVNVSGRVQEFRPGCFSCPPTSSAFANLTTTEIVSPTTVVVGSGPAIPSTIVGLGGRFPPLRVIENDSSGDVETSNTFDVGEDGIDFYESLEGMYVRIRNAVATGPRNDFGEISVLADFGLISTFRTLRGGIVVRRVGDYTYQEGDFNPERMILDDALRPTPVVDVRDRFTTHVDAVVDYNFGNFKFLVLNELVKVDGGLQREFARTARPNELVVATYNVENLDPTDAPSGRFQRAAEQIVQHMRSPDLINIEEIQDNDGAAAPAPSDASVTWRLLIEAIRAAGGPVYEYRQIDPLPGSDGGEPDGNIRVGFLFRTDRGLSFVDRPGGSAVTPNQVVDTPSGAELLYSPGRIDPNNAAFTNSRKPLAGEFMYRGRKLFVIGNHFNSKGGDDPLFGRFQPPDRRSEVQRHQQAAIVNDFVDRILAADRNAQVIVLGDLNDFQFSQTMDIVKGGVLVNLFDTLPFFERYTYVFDGNSQALDHILVTRNLLRRTALYDVVHMNAEFADQLTDHDPPLAYLALQ